MPETARACSKCHTPLPTYAAFCYACGTATPVSIDSRTGEFVVPESSGVTMHDVLPRLRALLGPSYELGERIGSGGFAEVFLARDLRLKRDVAVKVIRPEFALNALMIQRFRREAETIAALRHPHIMPIYDLGEAEGIAYLVMPFVRGESLKARLDRVGRLPAARARVILLQAADALAAAHEAGVVHRDVKPDNIMLDRREDQVLLMDFGIAKAIESGSEVSALTSTGLIMGTPHYMSPEQAAGERAVDARADQYALAVIAYRTLSGVLPFDGPTVRAVLAKQLVGAARPLVEVAPDAPPALVAAIERAMAKEPDDRFPTLRDFIDAVRADPSYVAEMVKPTSGGTASLTPISVPIAAASSPRPARGARRGMIVGGVTLLAAATGAVWWTSRSPTSAESAPPAATVGRTDSAAPAAPANGVPNATPPAATAVPDSVARRVAADSALVRRARLTFGTPPADSFLANMARSRQRSCEQRFAAGRVVNLAAICAAEARLDRAPAQRTLGQLAERAGRADSAVDWYERAAPRDVSAALRLAALLDDGRGTPADPARATTLIRTAADGGDVGAQRTLADRLARGVGAARDEAGAMQWYERAGGAGDVASMDTLAERYAKGRGVKKNEAAAVTWWQRAAERSDTAGLYHLGMAYLGQRGTPKMDRKQSDSVALDWLKKAAALGHPGAAYEVEKRAKKP